MRFGLKGTAAFAALGMSLFFSVPNASAFVPPDDDPIVVARTAEVISDVVDATGARVITVKMSDGEQFVIRDFSAGSSTVRRATHRDFDRDGDLEVRVALRDGRVIQAELEDVEFDDEDADEFALLVEDGDVVWDDEIALRYKTINVDDDDVNAYRSDDDDDIEVEKVDKIEIEKDGDVKVDLEDDDDLKIKVDKDDDSSDLDDDVDEAVEELGDKVEDLKDKTVDSLKEGADKTEDVVDEAADKTEDVVDEAADKVEDVVDVVTDDDPPNQ